MNEKITKEIDRLVAKYPWSSSRELFRTELEYLVMVANREGYAECAKKILKAHLSQLIKKQNEKY